MMVGARESGSAGLRELDAMMVALRDTDVCYRVVVAGVQSAVGKLNVSRVHREVRKDGSWQKWMFLARRVVSVF